MNGNLRRRVTGQGMTEYIIIVAVIAIAAIAVYALFGDTIRGQVGAMSQELAGADGGTSQDSAQTAAGKAEKQGAKQGGLGNFTGQNEDQTQ